MTDKEFVDRVFEEVRICGWEVDAVESWNFAEWLAERYDVEFSKEPEIYPHIYNDEGTIIIGYLKEDKILDYKTNELVGSAITEGKDITFKDLKGNIVTEWKLV